jgi:hypothetical protein
MGNFIKRTRKKIEPVQIKEKMILSKKKSNTFYLHKSEQVTSTNVEHYKSLIHDSQVFTQPILSRIVNDTLGNRKRGVNKLYDSEAGIMLSNVLSSFWGNEYFDLCSLDMLQNSFKLSINQIIKLINGQDPEVTSKHKSKYMIATAVKRLDNIIKSEKRVTSPSGLLRWLTGFDFYNIEGRIVSFYHHDIENAISVKHKSDLRLGHKNKKAKIEWNIMMRKMAIIYSAFPDKQITGNTLSHIRKDLTLKASYVYAKKIIIEEERNNFNEAIYAGILPALLFKRGKSTYSNLLKNIPAVTKDFNRKIDTTQMRDFIAKYKAESE